MAPKLRASCDTCNQAKVKCTKTRPTCSRCQKYGEECVYSISLRAGKRPAYRTMAENGRNLSMNSSTEALDEWATHSRTPSLNMAFDDGTLPFFNYGAISPVDTLTSTSPTSIHQPQQQESPEQFKHQVHQQISDMSAMTFPTSSSPFTQPAMNDFPLETPYPVMPTPTQTPFNGASTPCQCFKSIMLTLQTLQNLSESPFTAFDLALACNKEAMTLCTNALQSNCACSTDINYIMMLVLLVSKVILVYQMCCSTWSFNPSAEQESSSLRVTLGVYQMDKEDEGRFKVEIVRTELLKVQALILRLQESTFPTQMDTESRMYDAMIEDLYSKAQSALKDLKGSRRENIAWL